MQWHTTPGLADKPWAYDGVFDEVTPNYRTITGTRGRAGQQVDDFVCPYGPGVRSLRRGKGSRLGISVLALVLAASACTGENDEEPARSPAHQAPPSPEAERIAFPQYRRPGAPQVGRPGRLILRDGCLLILPEAGRPQLVLWPPGFRLVRDAQGFAVADESGTILARVGDEVMSGGGEVGLRKARELTGETFPEACRTNNFWMLGEIYPLE